MEQFYEDLRCRGISKSEVIYTDDKKVSARETVFCSCEGAPASGSLRGPERESCQPELHSEAEAPAFKGPPHCRDS